MGPRTDSNVSYAKITLPYPIFAAEFDPYNRGYLVVGGGGGESKTGVPNQISVLDVSNRAEITTAAEISLSREEDSVQSIGSLATKDGLLTFAGINSSQDQQNAGNNQHLRAFEVTYPPRKKQKTESDNLASAQGTIKPLGATKLFQTSSAVKKETYQRILRLSPCTIRDSPSRRIGAIATGLAKDPELIVFSAASPSPTSADVITRIAPQSEVVDIDIGEPVETEFSLLYCTDHDMYEQSLKYDSKTKKAKRTPSGPRKIYSMPTPDATLNSVTRSKFRSIRFLNADNVIALVNKPNKSGAELRFFHLYPTGPCFQTQEKTLPLRVKQATSMDVCMLDADEEGNQQVVVAVAGQDISIEVYTINFKAATDTFSSLRSYLSMKDVHEHQITKMCFAPFHALPRIESTEKTAAGTQYIRLASASYGNTVVVDTFPLKPLDESNAKSRLVLSHPSDERRLLVTWLGVGAIAVIFLGLLLQPLLTGLSHEEGISSRYAPAGGRRTQTVVDKVVTAHEKPLQSFGKSVASVASVASDIVPSDVPGRGRLLDLINKHLHPHGSQKAGHGHGHGHDHVHHDQHSEEHATEGHIIDVHEVTSTKALIVRPQPEGGISVELHEDTDALRKEDTQARAWHELEEHERTTWRQRLAQAGHWAEGQGEAILKGVLFSEYGGIVGQLLHG